MSSFVFNDRTNSSREDTPLHIKRKHSLLYLMKSTNDDSFLQNFKEGQNK